MSPLVIKLPWSSDRGHLNLESLVSVCLPKWGVYADAFEQVDAPVDGAQVDVERPGQAFLAHAPIDSAADHVVLGDRRQPRDMMVLRVTFVVFGEQAGANAHAQLLEGQHTQVAVQQQVLGLFAVGLETDSGSISPTSLMLETICLYLRVLITPSGTFLLGSNWSNGIW